MWLLKNVLEKIISWFGPFGLLLIFLITILFWSYFDFSKKEATLDFKELSGLVLLTVVSVGIGNLVIKKFKEKKHKISKNSYKKIDS